MNGFICSVSKCGFTTDIKGSVCLLHNPKMLDVLVKELNKVIAGEELNKLILLVITGGKFLKNVQESSSFNCIVSGGSSSGKDYLCKNLLSLFPKNVEHHQKITPTSLAYWHNAVTEPKFSWDGKICYLEDVSQEILDCSAYKTMTSLEPNSTHSTLLTDLKSKEKARKFSVIGKAVYVCTSAKATTKDEVRNRHVFLKMDESKGQTQAILRFKKGEIEPQVITLLNKLERVSVDISDIRNRIAEPYVKTLGRRHVVARRDFGRFLDFVASSCAWHQLQREKNEKGQLIPTKQDYDIAKVVFEQMNSIDIDASLSANEQKIIAAIRELQQNGDWIELRQILPRSPVNRGNTYKILNNLVEAQKVEQEYRREPELNNREVRFIRLPSDVEFKLPNWSDIYERDY